MRRVLGAPVGFSLNRLESRAPLVLFIFYAPSSLLHYTLFVSSAYWKPSFIVLCRRHVATCNNFSRFYLYSTSHSALAGRLYILVKLFNTLTVTDGNRLSLYWSGRKLNSDRIRPVERQRTPPARHNYGDRPPHYHSRVCPILRWWLFYEFCSRPPESLRGFYAPR